MCSSVPMFIFLQISARLYVSTQKGRERNTRHEWIPGLVKLIGDVPRVDEVPQDVLETAVVGV